jgi:hypothetical protein
MKINIFSSIYDQVDPNCIFDSDWETIRSVLMDHQDSESKESTKMFNLFDFKTTDYEAHDNGKIRRCAANTVGVWGLVLDFDSGITIMDAHQQFQDYEFVLYTTFRHVEDGITHKFRVILPFEEMLSVKDFAAKKESFKKFSPNVDESTFSAARAFYLHSGKNEPVAYYNNGKFLNPNDFESVYPKPIVYVDNGVRYKHASNYTQAVIKHLATMSGLRYAHALDLANAVKGSGGTLYDFVDLVNRVFASDSSYLNEKQEVIQNNFDRAYQKVSKLKINEFLRAHGGKQLQPWII